jgi:hypothetical protein
MLDIDFTNLPAALQRTTDLITGSGTYEASTQADLAPQEAQGC